MIVWISIVVALVGLVVYLAAKDKIAELGRIAFFAGLFVFLLQFGPRLVGLLGK